MAFNGEFVKSGASGVIMADDDEDDELSTLYIDCCTDDVGSVELCTL